jgi:predicted NBD/HSP70 family sugar kinase
VRVKQLEIKKNGHFSHHALSDKERKNLVILELIRKKGPISRTDISKITDINMVSISKYMKSFLDENLVVEKGFTASTGGRRPELVEFNPKGGYVIGVDVSSGEYRAVMMDLGLNVAGEIKRPRGNSGKKEDEDAVVSLVDELVLKSGIEAKNIKGIGVGASSNDLGGLKPALEKRFGMPVYAATEAATAAYGEKKLNPAADVEDMLYMHSDVGCGIVVMGDIYFGAGGNAGDMVSFNELIAREEEGSVFKGAQYLRPWCVDLGMIETAKREIERGIGTKMVGLAGGDIRGVTRQVVIEAARQSDEIALDIVKNVAVNLGIRIAYLVNIFDPEVVVVGGCMEKAGDLVLEPIRKEIKKFTVSRQSDRVRIIPSVLGDNAVSLGAAALVIREVFIKAQ